MNYMRYKQGDYEHAGTVFPGAEFAPNSFAFRSKSISTGNAANNRIMCHADASMDDTANGFAYFP